MNRKLLSMSPIAYAVFFAILACSDKSASDLTGLGTNEPVAGVSHVASVRVSLPASTITLGQTTQASVTLLDSSDNVITGRAVTWSSSNTSNATVDANGLISTVSTGAATITASADGQSGSATITVSAAVSTPPPSSDPPPSTPPPSSGTSNEPAGMTRIDERAFNSIGEGDSPHFPSWGGSGLSIVSDPTAPKSPSGVIRATYPAGFGGGSAPGSTGLEGQGLSNRVFYASFWAKHSANWWGHVTGVNKHAYFGANGQPGQVYFESDGTGNGSLVPSVVLQSGLGTDGIFAPNLVPRAVIPRGQWFRVEVVLVGNSSGNSDGTADWFLNGVHVGSRTGLRFTTGATSWDRFVFDPVWGGVGDRVPATQTLDWDHVYVSGKK